MAANSQLDRGRDGLNDDHSNRSRNCVSRGISGLYFFPRLTFQRVRQMFADLQNNGAGTCLVNAHPSVQSYLAVSCCDRIVEFLAQRVSREGCFKYRAGTRKVDRHRPFHMRCLRNRPLREFRRISGPTDPVGRLLVKDCWFLSNARSGASAERDRALHPTGSSAKHALRATWDSLGATAS